MSTQPTVTPPDERRQQLRAEIDTDHKRGFSLSKVGKAIETQQVSNELLKQILVELRLLSDHFLTP